jgi:hypothetical protein
MNGAQQLAHAGRRLMVELETAFLIVSLGF